METEVWEQKVAMEVKREAAYVSVSSAIYAINNWVSGKHRSEKRNCPSVSSALLVIVLCNQRVIASKCHETTNIAICMTC